MKRIVLSLLLLLLLCTTAACSNSENVDSQDINYYMTESNPELQSKCEDKEQIKIAESVIENAKVAYKTSIQEAYGKDLGELSRYCPDESTIEESDKIDLTIEYLNTKQDGDSGYVWVKYSVHYIDKQGKEIQGTYDALSRWEIKKEGSKWKVTKITELP